MVAMVALPLGCETSREAAVALPGEETSIETSYRIVARVGPESGPDTEVRTLQLRATRSGATRPVREEKIGTGVRHAACVMDALSFSTGGPSLNGEGRLLVSLAAGKSPMEYTIEARIGGAQRLIKRVTIPAGDPRWVDLTIPLPLRLAIAEEFRFAGSSTDPSARFCVGGILFAAAERSRSQPPNVVLVSLDTLGADYLGPDHTSPSLTPNLDRLRNDSFVFDNAFAQYPATLGSHSSLFSGLYPGSHKRFGLYPGHRERFTRASQPFVSLVTRFADSGYLAAGITEDAYVGSSFGFATAFDEYDDGAHRARGDAPGTFARAADWLEKRGADERFFLFVHTYEVHEPYRPRDQKGLARANSLTPGDERVWTDSEQYRMMRDHPNEVRLADPDVHRLESLHEGEIEYLDRQLAEFLSRLDEAGLGENTIVVLFSDHGEEFLLDGPLGHGVTLRNRVLHVPLYFRWPGQIPPGSSSSLVEVTDVLPTLLDLAALPIPPGLDGSTLRPRMNSGEPEKDFAYAELVLRREECTHQGRQMRPCNRRSETILDGRWKLLRRKLNDQDWHINLLYDLDQDPGETTNIAAAHPEVFKRLNAAIEERSADFTLDTTDEAESEAEIDDVTRRRLEALGYLE